MGLYRTDGIVLRTRPFGEADKILVIFTREKGKIEAVARGARRPRSRLVGAAQPFSYLKVLIFEGKNLDELSQAEIVKSFGAIRGNLLQMAYAAYWTELLDAFLPFHEPNTEVFLFTLAGLLVLEKNPEPSLLSRAFELRLLNYLGYSPTLSTCAYCGQDITSSAPAGFSPVEGGVICARCRSSIEVKPLPFSKAGVDLMSRLTSADLRTLAEWKVESALKTEVEKALLSFVEYRAEKPLKSLAFLQSMLSS